MTIGIINIGLGNLGSIKNCLTKNNIQSEYIDDPRKVRMYNKVILPGVGSFSSYINELKKSGFIESLNEFVADSNNTLIGICVGMQVFFESGDEGGLSNGLSYFNGKVTRLSSGINGRVPNVGWSEVKFIGDLEIFNGSYYFTHSYANFSSSSAIGIAVHNSNFTAAAHANNIYGFQFHPEKSGKLGSDLLSWICK